MVVESLVFNSTVKSLEFESESLKNSGVQISLVQVEPSSIEVEVWVTKEGFRVESKFCHDVKNNNS